MLVLPRLVIDKLLKLLTAGRKGDSQGWCWQR